MCYKLVLPTATKTEEEEEQMKSKKLSQKISQVHQVHWNYPSSLTFLSALTKLLSASVSFQSESSLVTWPNTARWFAKMDISASVQKQQGHWSASAIKHELAMPWKWTISAFFYKTCLRFRSCYMWRIMHGNQLFFLSAIYRFLQINYLNILYLY